MTKKEASVNLKQYCSFIYALYALSAILEMNEFTLLSGILVIVVAYFLNVSKTKRAEAKGTIFESHLRWALRTFIIGTFVILPVAVLIATVAILTFTNIASVTTIVNQGDMNALMSAIRTYMHLNIVKIVTISMFTIAPTMIWWLRRCWVGYRLLQKDQPVKNVTSWL